MFIILYLEFNLYNLTTIDLIELYRVTAPSMQKFAFV